MSVPKQFVGVGGRVSQKLEKRILHFQQVMGNLLTKKQKSIIHKLHEDFDKLYDAQQNAQREEVKSVITPKRDKVMEIRKEIQPKLTEIGQLRYDIDNIVKEKAREHEDQDDALISKFFEAEIAVYEGRTK